MKRTVKILLPVFILALIAFLGLKISSKIATKKELTDRIHYLPSFSFVKMDGRKFSRDSIKTNNDNVIICYFDPECSHCQYMAAQMEKNFNSLSIAQIIMVTNADNLPVKHFVNDYHLDGIKNITVLRDPSSSFYKIWGSAVTPSFFIYKKGAIAKVFMGETKIENIIDAIR